MQHLTHVGGDRSQDNTRNIPVVLLSCQNLLCWKMTPTFEQICIGRQTDAENRAERCEWLRYHGRWLATDTKCLVAAVLRQWWHCRNQCDSRYVKMKPVYSLFYPPIGSTVGGSIRNGNVVLLLACWRLGRCWHYCTRSPAWELGYSLAQGNWEAGQNLFLAVQVPRTGPRAPDLLWARLKEMTTDSPATKRCVL
jgi:hypothetical protein